jgi:hypothetical protein
MSACVRLSSISISRSISNPESASKSSTPAAAAAAAIVAAAAVENVDFSGIVTGVVASDGNGGDGVVLTAVFVGGTASIAISKAFDTTYGTIDLAAGAISGVVITGLMVMAWTVGIGAAVGAGGAGGNVFTTGRGGMNPCRFFISTNVSITYN